MAANRAAIVKSTTPQLRALLPILKQAENETKHKLGRFFAMVNPDTTYTRHMNRVLLGQLRTSIDLIERRVGGAFAKDLTVESAVARTHGMARLQNMVEVGSRHFEGSIRPLKIDVAAVMTNSSRMAWSRHRGEVGRYVGELSTDIRSRLMLGVLRGETVDQLTSRLLQSTGLIRELKRQNKVGEGVAENLFNRYRSSAERIATTELVNAYATVQNNAIIEAEKTDPGWFKMWDAAADKRVCLYCRRLDRTYAEPDGAFPDPSSGARIPHPPLHPRCRCALVPWRMEWAKTTK